MTRMKCNTQNHQISIKRTRILQKFFSNPPRPLSWLQSLPKRFSDILIFVSFMAQFSRLVWIAFARTTFRQKSSCHSDMNHFYLCFNTPDICWWMYLSCSKVIFAISLLRMERWFKNIPFKNRDFHVSNTINPKYY